MAERNSVYILLDKSNKFIVFIFIQSLLYGIGNPMTKIAFESLSVYWCLAFRFTLAFLLFFVIFRKRIIREIKRAKPRDYLPASICMAAAYISVNLALQWTTATNVGFLMSLPVVIAPVFASVILKTKYEWKHIPVQAFVVVGLYLLCSGEEGFVLGKGEVFAIITAVSVAGALVYGEKSLQDMSAVTVSAAQAGLTAVVSLALALSLEEFRAAQVTPAAWGVVIYLALGCTFAAYLIQNTAVAKLSSQMVSMLQTSQPVLTAVCSFFVLGEVLTLKGYIGAGVILGCIVVESLFAAHGNREIMEK